MKILPVLDVMRGHVVRGIAGRRHEYRPIQSRLTNSTDPGDVALAFRQLFGFNQLYLADLDALGGQPPALALYDRLQTLGFRLWIDAGVRTAADVVPLLDLEVATVVVGLETVAGAEALAAILERASAERVVFSLDLKGGRPLGFLTAGQTEPRAIAETALALGVRRILVLDLERVGVGAGVGTETLCHELRGVHPDLELTAGGGVRGLDDLRALREAGVNYALVASALHDGRIFSPVTLGQS